MFLYNLLSVFLISQIVANDDCKTHQRSTYLWSVTSPKTNTHNFLFGTIHVAYDQVWDSVSAKVKEALNQVQGVVFELALHDPETVNGLIDCKQLEYGKSLKTILPQSMFQRLKQYIKRKKQRLIRNSDSKKSKKEIWSQINHLIGSWESRRPVWLLFLLYQLNEQEYYKESDSLSVPMFDAYLAHSAKEKGKKLYSIESPTEQCNPLIRVNKQQIIFAINYTLSYMEWAENREKRKRESAIDRLIKLYNCGDEQVTNFESEPFTEAGFTLNEAFDRKAKEIDERLKWDIIEHRNMRMALRTHHLIQEHPQETFLFAVGAGHFHGPFSLINVLQGYGYKIEKVEEDTDIRPFHRPSNFKTFNELWVRRAKEMNVMGIHDKDTNTNANYIYFVLFFIPVILIIGRKIGNYYFFKPKATPL
ncbi:unnamed protein product [Bursaphelenchus xylophilus]|uniref:Metalloprotease TIKI homolog n=1 Tax=Bursaphelenchus xylophilus TaxID=6326 RepID=A0A1I7SU67_BURXY|nr:unnamed protein product [Bursaphelenchus xylophilus]CAG9107509.1 unnamed protein product [Bursaphelenchus xylophilus]